MSNIVWKKSPDALACTTLLERGEGEVAIERYSLQKGAVWKIPTYSMRDQAQIFFFLQAGGYIVTDSKGWNIEANSMFIPDFDKEEVLIKATGQNLELIRFTFNMSPYDVDLYIWYHMILPRYVTYDRAFSYVEEHTGLAGSGICTSNLVVETAFGRWAFGMDYGTGGQEFVCEHSYPEFDQWMCALPGARFICSVNGATRQMQENDVLFVPMGAKQEIPPADTGKIRYLWLRCATKGWSKGRDGDIGSEP